ncbi:hypothetical protein [Micromonospora arida]
MRHAEFRTNGLVQVYDAEWARTLADLARALVPGGRTLAPVF